MTCLIDQSTNFQMFHIQIPEDLFSKMLKARIVNDIFHFRHKSEFDSNFGTTDIWVSSMKLTGLDCYTACHDWLTLHIKSELKKKMTFTYYWVALRQLPILYYKIFPQKIPPTLQSPLWLSNRIVIFFLIQTVPVKFPK